MRLILDFSDTNPHGKIHIVSKNYIAAAVAAFIVVVAVAVYLTANLIAAYWVTSGASIVSDIARKEIHAVNEDRARLWNESISTLEDNLATTSTRIINLYRKGAILSHHVGLPGDKMFDADSDGIHNDVLCTNHIDRTLSPEEQQISFVDLLYQKNIALDVLERKYGVLQNRSIQNAVLAETLPIERPILGRNWLSSRYGYRRDPFTGRRAFHAGDDYAANRGTPIIASADGIVVYAGRLGNYGNTVQLYHGGDVSTLYGHMHKIHVSLQQYVEQGDVIGTVGSTGRSTGPHLHYEIRINNRPKPIRKTIKQLRRQRNLESTS